eukprot:TRINITY_DN83469_c0_g1_i1.p1 TRINITY_DN83469_c0_g1~~TRINITY_DN83469_c0_g1_i1.p1  ORF type:complete len:347 (-),score=31.05 TRINITY_DN83469_c0_g1_i1:108-1148(-)
MDAEVQRFAIYICTGGAAVAAVNVCLYACSAMFGGWGVVFAIPLFLCSCMLGVCYWYKPALGSSMYSVDGKGMDTGICRALLGFVLFVVTASCFSSVTDYHWMQAHPALADVHVCSHSDWRQEGSIRSGVYLADGSLTHDLHGFDYEVVRMDKCRWASHMNGKLEYWDWQACNLGIRPIFECDSGKRSVDSIACAVRPCAWAITFDGTDPIIPQGCGGRPCGFYRPDRSVFSGPCAGKSGSPAGWDCLATNVEVVKALEAAAENMHTSYEEGAPFVELMNPQDILDEKRDGIWSWWASVIVYSFAPIVIFLPLVIYRSSSPRGGHHDLQSEASEEEADDDEETIVE